MKKATGWAKGAAIVLLLVLGMGLLAALACTKRSPSEQEMAPATSEAPTAPANQQPNDPMRAASPAAVATGDPGQFGIKGARPHGEAGGAARSLAPGVVATGAPPSGGDGSPRGPSEAAIDPNGRFATTYRPGGGHLAAFESAVARGVVPAGEREIVSDLGARYVATLDPPKGKAVALRTDVERSKLAPTGGATHLRFTLQSTNAAPSGRPHLSVHLVLDLSGSMRGESVQRAREAASALVDKLAATDDFSLVTFSSDAEVKVPDGPVGPRRESIKQTIAGLVEGGGTNIGRGLELGYIQAQSKGIPEDAVRVVLLLSDGRANAGITNSDQLARMALDAFQQGIQTSSFGLGADYDGELMSLIARDGAGGYYYLRDPEQISPALATELDKRLDPVATAVEVRVRLRPGVDLLKVYGSRRLTESEAARVRAVEVAADQQAQKRDGIKKDREDDAKGGMRFFIPAFAKNDSHAILLKVRVPEGTGKRELALVELKFKDRVSKKNVIEEVPVAVAFAESDAASAQSADMSVARTVQGFAAGEALAEAATKIARGDRNGATALLTEREGILRQAAEALNEPLFLKDAERLARLRSHAGSYTGVGDPLVLSMLLETAALGHLR